MVNIVLRKVLETGANTEWYKLAEEAHLTRRGTRDNLFHLL
jgi:hypothetical protein